MNEAQGMSQDSGISPNPGVTSQPAPSSPAPSSAPTSYEPAHEEKTFRQSEVNSLVGREKARAIEEYRRQQAEQPHYVQQKYGEPATQHAPAQPQPSLNSEQEIRRLAADEAQRFSDQRVQEAQKRYETEAAQKLVQNFWNKVAPGKEKYADFDKVIGGVELGKYPHVVQMASSMIDNADDVMYYLGKDEAKMAELQRLAEDERFQHIAISKAKQLSQSLKDNEAASKVKVPNEPLSQMRPSNTGTDNGVMGVSDYRRKWKV